MTARVSFILGGARSGKSARALSLALAGSEPYTFLATAEALDEEMADRIDLHKSERGLDWGLIEAPLEIAPAIKVHQSGVMVVDCLTLWLSNLMHHDRDIPQETHHLTQALGTSGRIILVSNEVGLAIAPENALARQFRDAQGRLNQAVAVAADHVEFIAAGLPLTLKGQP